MPDFGKSGSRQCHSRKYFYFYCKSKIVYITKNIATFLQSIPARVKLVAVSKTKPVEDILEAYHAGQKAFGENKVQELVQKYEALPKDIEWHFIGHPQTNKIKFIAPFVHLIHGVDSLKLLNVVDSEGAKNKRKVACLLQFHIAGESTKFGLNTSEAEEILNDPEFSELKNIEIAGVMGMATFTDDEEQIRSEFRTLKSIFDSLKNSHFQTNESFNVISMGMSDDYPIAIAEGSTMVRIGSKIFGERNYQHN